MQLDVKEVGSYIAYYPVRVTVHERALYTSPSGRPDQSANNSTYLGKIQPHIQLLHKDYSLACHFTFFLNTADEQS